MVVPSASTMRERISSARSCASVGARRWPCSTAGTANGGRGSTVSARAGPRCRSRRASRRRTKRPTSGCCSRRSSGPASTSWPRRQRSSASPASCRWTTRHTAVARVNRERLAANAREAAEQCERLSVPEVAEPRRLFDLLGDWPTERRLLLCAEAGPSRPLAEVLQEAATEASGPWAVLIGPEGGFAESELDALRKLPFVTAVGLGPRILRSDTAALAALACWQAVLGDGREAPQRD